MIGRGLLLTAASAVVLIGSPAASASSGDARIQLSSDGVHWSTGLDAPLFDPAVLWVPGDVRTASLYVRNQGSGPAEVRVEVRTDDAEDLVRTHDLRLEARTAGDTWSPTRSAAGPRALNAVAIEVDGSRRVDLRAAFGAASANDSQRGAVSLQFVVSLAEVVVPTIPPDEDLPGTGAPRLSIPLLLAGLLIGTGLALVRRPVVARG